jgi:hypothetical protein
MHACCALQYFLGVDLLQGSQISSHGAMTHAPELFYENLQQCVDVEDGLYPLKSQSS